jgi:tol-pal system protein YbgF
MQLRAHSLRRLLAMPAGALLLCLTTTGASAQYDDTERRLESIERTLQDLQAEIYRDGNIPPSSGAGPAENMPQGKLYDVEASLRQLTGQVEQLTFEIRQLKDRYERFERDTQYRLATIENGGKPPENFPPPGDSSTSGSLPSSGGPTDLATTSTPTPDTSSGPVILGQQPTTPPAPETNTASLPQGTLGTITGPATPSGSPADALYQSGIDQLAKAQYEPAKAAFEQLVSQHGDSPQAPQAQFFIADIHFVQKNYRDAAVSYAALIKKYPQSDRAPDAMLKLGLSLIQMGQTKEGCTTLGAIGAKYPKASDTITNRAQRESKKAGCA